MNRLCVPKVVARMSVILVVAASLAACGERAKDPENELPFGYVDQPKAGAIIGPGKTFVGGWALDDHGVVEIRIFVDGRYKTSTRLAVSRPDVVRTSPRYARHGDVYGWNVDVDCGTIAGDHTILVQAVDDNGATRDIGTVPVKIRQ